MNSSFRSPARSLRITLAWSAAGCPWSLEKCGLRACLTFTKITFFSRCQRQTVPFLLRVKEPPSGVSASADTPGRHGALGFCRRTHLLEKGQNSNGSAGKINGVFLRCRFRKITSSPLLNEDFKLNLLYCNSTLKNTDRRKN